MGLGSLLQASALIHVGASENGVPKKPPDYHHRGSSWAVSGGFAHRPIDVHSWTGGNHKTLTPRLILANQSRTFAPTEGRSLEPGKSCGGENNMAMKNGPCIDDLPKKGDFQQLCYYLSSSEGNRCFLFQMILGAIHWFCFPATQVQEGKESADHSRGGWSDAREHLGDSYRWRFSDSFRTFWKGQSLPNSISYTFIRPWNAGLV